MEVAFIFCVGCIGVITIILCVVHVKSVIVSENIIVGVATKVCRVNIVIFTIIVVIVATTSINNTSVSTVEGEALSKVISPAL